MHNSLAHCRRTLPHYVQQAQMACSVIVDYLFYFICVSRPADYKEPSQDQVIVDGDCVL